MHSLGENGEGKLRGHLANPGLTWKMAIKPVYVYV